MTHSDIGDPISDAVARLVAVAALGGIALIHVLQSPAAFEGALYVGILFVLAIVAAVVLGAALTRLSDDRVWAAAALLPALLLLGYVLSRTSGLPWFTVDVGEWTEPLGLASLVVEGLLVCVAGAVLAMRRQTADATAAVVIVETTTRQVPPPGAAAA
jgi:hypothetical protein